MSGRIDSSTYGSRGGSGAASIDIVVKDVPVGREFTEAEVDLEVIRRGLKRRGAISNHLRFLKKLGHVARTDNGWKRLN